MKVKYKVVDYRPDAEWIAVEFTDPDRPDMDPWIKQFTFPDFSREKLIDHLHAIASQFAGSWTRIPDHATELTIPEEGVLEVEPELYLPYEPHPVLEPEPEFDMWTQEIIPGDVTDVTQEVISWTVRDLSQEEIDAQLEHYAGIFRWDRDELLRQSDFFNFPDACVANVQDWLEYRQALRDVPQQDGFPKKIIWPERPEVVKETIE